MIKRTQICKTPKFPIADRDYETLLTDLMFCFVSYEVYVLRTAASRRDKLLKNSALIFGLLSSYGDCHEYVGGFGYAWRNSSSPDSIFLGCRGEGCEYIIGSWSRWRGPRPRSDLHHRYSICYAFTLFIELY